MGAIHPQIQAELDKLYHLVALALSPQSLPPSAFAAQAQTVWWIDAVHGSPNNSGLVQAQAVDSWLTIAKRYTAGIPGLRPMFNPTGGTCTIHVVGTTPTSDPASVLLYAYYALGAQVNVVGVAQAPSHTGTLATASVFARTNAGGQVTITDAAVADFHPFVPSLIVDTTSGAVGFLVEPRTGSSATAHVSIGYSAQTVGGFPIQTQTNYAATDSYEILPLATIYLGSLLGGDAFPAETPTAAPQLSFYRLAFSAEVSGDGCLFTSDFGLTVAIQECLTSQGIEFSKLCFGVAANVGSSGLITSYAAELGAQISVIAGGFGYAGAVAGTGANILFDQDWALYGDTNRPHIALDNGTLAFGQSSAWFTGGPGEVLAIEGGCAVFAASFATCVFYGNSPGNFIVMTYSGGQSNFIGEIRYPNTAAVATFQFNGTPTIGTISTPFSPNLATGAYVGPTTATAAHLDATPAAAGTALAGIAVDLGTGNRIIGL